MGRGQTTSRRTGPASTKAPKRRNSKKESSKAHSYPAGYHAGRREALDNKHFDKSIELPYGLDTEMFKRAMYDVLDGLDSLNDTFAKKSRYRFEEQLDKATLTSVFSNLLTDAIARYSPELVKNTYHNGHPDIVLAGAHPDDSAKSADEGVEVKATVKESGGFDAHGARTAWYLFARLSVDRDDETYSHDRKPTVFKEVHLARLESETHFRRNDRGELGTRTASPHKEGMRVLRDGLIYKLKEEKPEVQD